MANDAQVQSLTAHALAQAAEQSLNGYGRTPEQRLAELEAILPHLAQTAVAAEARIAEHEAEAQAIAARYERRISVCLANSAAASARAELAISKAQESVHAKAILERVADEAEHPRHAERKCRRKLPPGWGGVITGGAAAIVLAAKWLWHGHKASAIAGTAALLTAASAPLAAQYLPDTSARLMAPVAHHHFHAHHVDPDPVTAAIPPRRRHRSALASSQKRKQPVPKGGAAPAATPPSPVPSPVTTTPAPSPSPTATDPGPSPTATPTGAPSPGGTPAAAYVLNRMLPGTAAGHARWDN